MCIRKINHEEDIKAIEDVWFNASGCENEQNWGNVHKEIKCPNNITYVKTRGGSIVAFVTIRRKGITSLQNYIFEIFSHPQSQGFGSELLKEMQNKRLSLSLHVKKTNTDGIRFYENNGFRKKLSNHCEKYQMEWKSQP